MIDFEGLRNGIKGVVSGVKDSVKSTADGVTRSLTTTDARPTGCSFDEARKHYHDDIVTGLAGAAVGGGIGAMTTDTEDDETMGQKIRHRLGNALTGAAAGGAVGVGGKTLLDKYGPKPEPEPSKLNQIVGTLVDKARGIDRSAPPVPGAPPLPPSSTANSLLNPTDSSLGNNLATGAVEGIAAGKILQKTYDGITGSARALTKETLLKDIATQEGLVGKSPAAAPAAPRTPPAWPGAGQGPGARPPAAPAGAPGAHLPSGFPGYNNQQHLDRLRAVFNKVNGGSDGITNAGRSLGVVPFSGRRWQNQARAVGVTPKSRIGAILQMVAGFGIPAAAAIVGEKNKVVQK